MSRNVNGMFSAVPMAVYFLDDDRDYWSDMSDLRSLGSHETQRSDVISEGSTLGGDLDDSDMPTDDEFYDLDDSFIVDMEDTSSEESWRGDDESDETFNSANYIHVLDKGSEDVLCFSSDDDEVMATDG